MTGSGALPPFAVVIVSYASSALLRHNASTMALPPGGRVVVVDCFTDERERERVRALAGERGWDAVLLEENAGYGGGTNAGARRAIELGAEVIVPLNPDARAEGAALARLVAAVAADPQLIASPTIVSSTGAPWFSGADLYLADGVSRGARARQRFEGEARRAWATGACFAISTALWLRLGGFDEDYFLYWEDIDLSHRALDAGARLAVIDATIVHDEGGTHGQQRTGRAKSELYYTYSIRNRLLYASKHLEPDAARHWQRSAPRVALGVLLQGGRRQLVTSWRPWRALLRGLREGNRALRQQRAPARRGEA
ncbi:glycosyltransferase family 2 protein [Agrococcus sp. 1P02AA]|uniref:glycosyltransferase family 2 protein n=1 Tax=Agrococcus sp. 1P02AA TaxID=3132259 RepID=UPI0039A6D7FB